jgi:hypothetical protein
MAAVTEVCAAHAVVVARAAADAAYLSRLVLHATGLPCARCGCATPMVIDGTVLCSKCVKLEVEKEVLAQRELLWARFTAPRAPVPSVASEISPAIIEEVEFVADAGKSGIYEVEELYNEVAHLAFLYETRGPSADPSLKEFVYNVLVRYAPSE